MSEDSNATGPRRIRVTDRDWAAVLLGLARDLESDDEDRLRASDAADLRGAAAEIKRLRALPTRAELLGLVGRWRKKRRRLLRESTFTFEARAAQSEGASVLDECARELAALLGSDW